ncbi:inversin-B-like [Hydractinia symbiolongicarpus]|uniref:inversin-B-like n=1 Tax=Hydractinia symbiolongicarpus TaxID=13093 RepID=UPI00254F0242|nr:inversin-B-like [Hydractinia symbiolongicarpus]
MFDKSINKTKSHSIIKEGKPSLDDVYEESENDGTLRSSQVLPTENIDGPSPIHLLAINGNKIQLSEYIRTKKDAVDEEDNMRRTPLIYSVLGDRVDCVLVLLKAGANINKCDVDKRTALHWAAYQGNHKLVKLLISYGANCIARDKEGRTALHLSASHNNIKVLQALLRSMTTGEIDTPDNKKMTALAWSVFYDRIEFVVLLLQKGANPASIDSEKRTVLHWTSENKDASILKMLIEQDPFICNWNDCEGRTALHMAVGQSNYSLVEFLLSVDKIEVNCIDHMHRTPLHWAAVLGNKSLVLLLLKHGADYTLSDNNGVRALHYAAQNNAHEVVQVMLNKKGIKDIPDDKQGTALMWAAVKGCDAVVKTLLESKCSDPNAADIHGQTALHMSTQAGHLNCVKLLIENGAHVDTVDVKHHIPLFYACASGHVEIVTELLSHGSSSNLDDRDLEGRCPLHYAAMVDRTDIIKVLIQNNLDPNTKDNAGCPPLHFASYGGFVHCMSVLLENGADVNMQDNDGCTALHWACRSGSVDAVKLLVSRFGANVNMFERSVEQLTPLDYSILEDHQDVAFYLTENNAYTAASLKDLSAMKIQAVWRGYKFRRHFHEKKQLFLKHEIIRRGVSDTGGSYHSEQDLFNQKLGNIQTLQVYSNQNNMATNNIEHNTGPDIQLQNYLTTNHRKRSTVSNLSGNTVSSKSSVFHHADRGRSDLRSGPKFSTDNTNPMSLHKVSAGSLSPYSYLQKQGFDEIYPPARKTSTGSLPAVHGGLLVRDHKIYSSSSVVGEQSTMKNYNDTRKTASSISIFNGGKDVGQNNYTTMKTLKVANANHFIPHNNRPTHSSLSSAGSSDINNAGNTKKGDRNNWYNKTYSRYVAAHQQGSIISSSSESSALFETKPLNHVLSTIMQRKQDIVIDSGATSSVDVDLPSKHISHGHTFHGNVFPVDTDPEKPWNVYRRDQKRINMIRLKTDAAVIIQKAFRKYLSRKNPKQISLYKDAKNNVDLCNATSPETEIDAQKDEYCNDDVDEDDEEEENDEFTLQEVAALVIQLAWRQYLKNKLVSQQSNYSSFEDDTAPISSTDEESIAHGHSSLRQEESDDFDSSFEENKFLEKQGKKKLTASHSVPVNIYTKKKRSNKFSFKKRLLQRSSASSNSAESPTLASVQQPLSKSDASAIKTGKPKLFLRGRSTSRSNDNS